MTTCYTDDYFSQILLRSVESILLNHEQYNANPSSKQFFKKKQFCAIKNKFPLKKKVKNCSNERQEIWASVWVSHYLWFQMR